MIGRLFGGLANILGRIGGVGLAGMYGQQSPWATPPINPQTGQQMPMGGITPPINPSAPVYPGGGFGGGMPAGIFDPNRGVGPVLMADPKTLTPEEQRLQRLHAHRSGLLRGITSSDPADRRMATLSFLFQGLGNKQEAQEAAHASRTALNQQMAQKSAEQERGWRETVNMRRQARGAPPLPESVPVTEEMVEREFELTKQNTKPFAPGTIGKAMSDLSAQFPDKSPDELLAMYTALRGSDAATTNVNITQNDAQGGTWQMVGKPSSDGRLLMVNTVTGEAKWDVPPGAKAGETIEDREKAAAEAEKQAATKALRDSYKQSNIKHAADEIRGILTQNKDSFLRKNVGVGATGIGSALLSWLPESDANVLKKHTEHIRSNAALETLDQMRQASSTGASGLGAMSDEERKMIISAATALDPQLPEKDFLMALDRYEDTVSAFMEGKTLEQYRAGGAGQRSVAGDQPSESPVSDLMGRLGL